MRQYRYEDLGTFEDTRISFEVDGFKGIPLEDALEERFDGLKGAEEPVIISKPQGFTCGLHVSPRSANTIRLLVLTHLQVIQYTPFYQRILSSWSKRRDIARDVAKVVKEAMEENHGRWYIIPPFTTAVRFEDMLLLELKQVSSGSYQPVLAFFHPRYT